MRFRTSKREIDPERGSFADVALDTDVAAVSADDLLGDPQAEPDAADAFCGPRALEAIEDALAVLEGDARSAVAHAEHHPIAAILDDHVDRFSRRELQGIGQNIGDDLI